MPADYLVSLTAHSMEEREKHRRIRRVLFHDFKETAIGMMENIQDASESIENLLDKAAENIHQEINSHWKR